MRIIYVPLESYEERYTKQLRLWTEAGFARLGVNFITIEGESLHSDGIKTGAVLDAHQRCFYALDQMRNIVDKLYHNEITENDFIFFEDMFHPGIESLAYIIAQQFGVRKPKIGVRCLAQTLDPDDFVHYTGMGKWMRKYEQMVNSFVDVVFMASEEMLAMATVAGWTVPCVVTGLPFGKEEVIQHLGQRLRPFAGRTKRVLFASRMANEKQPEFFLQLAMLYKKFDPSVEFAICSGGLIKYPGLEYHLVHGNIKIYPNLKKHEYYEILNDSRVLFNCSLQDWVSNTLSEADALGCNVLFPAYRSFPEALNNELTNLYIPWSLEDAIGKLADLIDMPNKNQGKFSDKQDKSIHNTVRIMHTVTHSTLVASCNPQDTSYRKFIVKEAIK